eukprot:scaffold83616_cov16-Tisochrysis_lutea.AAC.1
MGKVVKIKFKAWHPGLLEGDLIAANDNTPLSGATHDLSTDRRVSFWLALAAFKLLPHSTCMPMQAGTAMYLFPLPGSGITHGKKARPDAGKYAIATLTLHGVEIEGRWSGQYSNAETFNFADSAKSEGCRGHTRGQLAATGAISMRLSFSRNGTSISHPV